MMDVIELVQNNKYPLVTLIEPFLQNDWSMQVPELSRML